MFNKKVAPFFVFFTSALILPCIYASNDVHRPFYFGGSFGHGATTWQGLVPNEQNQNMALGMSTPIKVSEGGLVGGAFLGYEFTPTFAIEASYMRYPQATVYFDPNSLFSFNNDDQTEFNTNTEVLSLMGKIMIPVSNTKWRLYSSIGIADVHRKDIMMDGSRLSPSFGVGLNLNISEHLMTELAANYTAGYGESQLEPSATYVPFLYSIFFRFAYRI